MLKELTDLYLLHKSGVDFNSIPDFEKIDLENIYNNHLTKSYQKDLLSTNIFLRFHKICCLVQYFYYYKSNDVTIEDLFIKVMYIFNYENKCNNLSTCNV